MQGILWRNVVAFAIGAGALFLLGWAAVRDEYWLVAICAPCLLGAVIALIKYGGEYVPPTQAPMPEVNPATGSPMLENGITDAQGFIKYTTRR